VNWIRDLPDSDIADLAIARLRDGGSEFVSIMLFEDERVDITVALEMLLDTCNDIYDPSKPEPPPKEGDVRLSERIPRIRKLLGLLNAYDGVLRYEIELPLGKLVDIAHAVGVPITDLNVDPKSHSLSQGAAADREPAAPST